MILTGVGAFNEVTRRCK